RPRYVARRAVQRGWGSGLPFRPACVPFFLVAVRNQQQVSHEPDEQGATCPSQEKGDLFNGSLHNLSFPWTTGPVLTPGVVSPIRAGTVKKRVGQWAPPPRYPYPLLVSVPLVVPRLCQRCGFLHGCPGQGTPATGHSLLVRGSGPHPR